MYFPMSEYENGLLYDVLDKFSSSSVVNFSEYEYGKYYDVIELMLERKCISDLNIDGGNIFVLNGDLQAFKEWVEQANEKADNSLNLISDNVASQKYDVFISHANKDKSDYVDELYLILRKLGISIFYDSDVLSWGDNWKQVILDGTEKSEFAIIVISENFFGREWTERELEEFLKRQNANGQKIVLPLLHNVTIDKLVEKYPDLGDIQMISTDKYSKEEIEILFAKELIKRLK